MTIDVTRRAAMLGAGALALEPCLSKSLLAQLGTSPILKIGDIEIRVISDGYLTVPARFLATNVDEAVIKQWLASEDRVADVVTPPANVTLVRTPNELILIDVGAGSRFMPTLGKLVDNLQAIGIEPKDINRVVITHAHPDHLWGIIDDFDELTFPNSTYVISEAELNFWMAADVATRLPADRTNFAPGAQRSLARIRDKLQTIKPGQEIATGIRVMDTAGHTPGHIGLEIASGREIIIVVADALTHPTISFAHPEWTPAADHFDRQQAVGTRTRLLDKLATDRQRMIGYHLPFPGIGTVQRAGAAYRFTPGF